LIGHIRSQQIAQNLELEAELAERSQHSAAVADLCIDLRSRAEMLERHIAANAQSSNIDVAEAITALQHATWEDFTDRLTRFVILMTGAAEFSVYLLRDNALKLAFQPTDEHRPAAEIVVPPDDPLFAAIVRERLTLSAARPSDHALLGERGIMAGPLVDQNTSDRVVGMFAIGGASLDDAPEDIERRFSLTCSEIARLAGRISLIDSWHAAAAPSLSNGHAVKHPDAAPEPEPAPESAQASPADSTSSRRQTEQQTRPDPALPDNELTLQ
jgi:hypothetical protein